jgi:hypothetical protein
VAYMECIYSKKTGSGLLLSYLIETGGVFSSLEVLVWVCLAKYPHRAYLRLLSVKVILWLGVGLLRGLYGVYL